MLYDRYMRLAPSPVIALNRAMAIAEHEDPTNGLRALAAIDGVERFREYPFYQAAHGELELRAGRRHAALHFEAAVELARNDGERLFLTRRLAECAK